MCLFPVNELNAFLDELPEIVDFWVGRSKHPRADVEKVCSALLKYTGGHIFPFINFARHLFDLAKLPPSPGQYVRSEEFSIEPVTERVNFRCFSNIGSPVIRAALHVFRGDRDPAAIDPLEQMALWSNETNWFISDHLTSYLFDRAVSPSPPERLNIESRPWPDIAQQIILAGLRGMQVSDFQEPRGTKYENGIGFNWGLHLKEVCPTNLHMSPQTQATPTGRGGSNPTVDWFFNHNLNAVIEMVRDGAKLNEHFLKFTTRSGTTVLWW
jgi:hypothetical protein